MLLECNSIELQQGAMRQSAWCKQHHGDESCKLDAGQCVLSGCPFGCVRVCACVCVCVCVWGGC